MAMNGVVAILYGEKPSNCVYAVSIKMLCCSAIDTIETVGDYGHLSAWTNENCCFENDLAER